LDRRCKAILDRSINAALQFDAVHSLSECCRDSAPDISLLARLEWRLRNHPTVTKMINHTCRSFRCLDLSVA
jgi:hypothetical protein